MSTNFKIFFHIYGVSVFLQLSQNTVIIYTIIQKTDFPYSIICNHSVIFENGGVFMSWTELLCSNLTTAEELQDYLHLGDKDYQLLLSILERFPMSVTRYYLSLIDWKDENDPIRRMCIPSIHEIDMDGSFDTSGEAGNTIMEGLQHKYRESAMILSTNQCASYCRYCFRRRMVGITDSEIALHYLDGIMDYIENHSEISNVLISGGDALLNSNRRLARYLDRLTTIDHLDFIRIGTRVPVVFPMRITDDPELLELLTYYKQRKQIYVITHFNHPREITPESTAAIRALLHIGIPVRNQTVFLHGVNDDAQVLGTLLKKLTSVGVLPYYLFQCRPVIGVKSQFQVPLKTGYSIVEAAKNMQNGVGKNFRFVLSHETGKIEILGLLEDGSMLFKYHQAKDPANAGRIFTRHLDENECWL